MMLLKRLLLPGKGDLIICILILLNVLLWCGESESKISSFSAPSSFVAPSVITTLLYKAILSSSYSFSYSWWCKNYGVALVTYHYLISLQFHRVYASAEEVLNVSKTLTQQPVFKKTDPLSMTLGSKTPEGGANLITNQHNGSNYNKKRRRPVHNNSSLNSNKISGSRSDGVLSSNSSNFLNNTFLVNKSDVNSDLFKGDGGSSNSSSNNPTVLANSETMLTLSSNETANNSNSMSSSTNGTLPSIANLKRRNKGRTRNATAADSSENTSKSQSEPVDGKKRRKPKLLKELTMFNRQNCLAKLLCGVQVAVPPTKSSSALNDYAYLVKAFFDRFSIRGIVTDVIDTAFAYEQDGLDLLDDEVEDEDHEHDTNDDDDDDDDSSERRKKNSRVKIGNTIIGGAGIHKPKTPQFQKYKPKFYERYDKEVDDIDLEALIDDDVPDFMQPDVFRRRHGKTLPKQFNQTERGNSTIGLKRSKRNILPVNINRVRRRRGIVGEVKRGFMGFFNPRFDKTAYLDKRQLELESTKSQDRQLNIAEEIVKRLRSPRQCRLLNWFGNNGNSNDNTVTSPNGMTTTITTITNTGGMVGNLERLGSAQPGIPQSSLNNNGANGIGPPGSQVVTVIQQSPLGSATTTSTSAPVVSSKASNMLNNLNNNLNKLNNMGQSASNAMAQATEVASHIGSTICPFNIQELQDLILKAQVAPFPHFLTTTPPSPTKITPAQIFSQSQPPHAVLTSSTTATDTSSSNLSPPTTPKFAASQSAGQTRIGFDSPFAPFHDEFTDPHPTPPRYHHPTSPQLQLYDDAEPPSRYHVRKPTPATPPRYTHDPKSPSRYHIRHTTTPIYPSPLYPSIIPPMGYAGNDNDNDDELFEDDPYAIYVKTKEVSPFERHKVHHPQKKKKLVPKWMTTTTLSPDDEFYGYNDAIPNYSYGTQQQGSYKLTNQQQQAHKTAQHHPGQSEFKRRPRPYNHPYGQKENEEILDGGLNWFELPKEHSTTPDPNFTREFHQPPVVVDSKIKRPLVGPRQTSAQKPVNPIGGKPLTQSAGQKKNKPQQNQKSEEDEDSDEDDPASSDNSGDDSDESNSSSGEADGRTNFPSKNKLRTSLSKPSQPSIPLRKPPEGRSVEGSDENDNDEGSNEAKEKKEKGAENDDDDDEENEEDSEEGEDDGENNGKRSYERNDYSKDRGGPPSASSTTEKPNNKKGSTNGSVSKSNGFFSNFFGSLPSFRSLFSNKKSKSDTVNNNYMAYPRLPPSPPRTSPPVSPNSFSIKLPDNQISKDGESEEHDEEENNDEPEDDDDNEEDEEDSDEVQVKETKKSKNPPTPKQKVVQPQKKINIQIKNKIPINPWVNDNTRIQVSLKTTPVPVVIEDSSSWSKPFWENEEDEEEDHLGENPIENYNDAVKKKNKKKQEASKKQKVGQNNVFSGLGISPDLSEFLSDLHRDRFSKNNDNEDEIQVKVVKNPSSHKVEDDEDDDDLSNESEEDTRLPRPPSFMSREPID